MPFDMNPFAFGYGPQTPPMRDLNGTGMDINQQPQKPPQQQTPGNPTSMIKSLMNKNSTPGTDSGATVEPTGLPDPAGAGTGLPDAATAGAASMEPATAGVGGEAAALGGGEVAGAADLGAGAADLGAGAGADMGAAAAGIGDAAAGAAAGIGDMFAGFSAADLLPLLFAA